MNTAKFWIARDKDGKFALYLAKPIRFTNSNGWKKVDNVEDFLTFVMNLDPNLEWKDEPFECELKVKNMKFKDFSKLPIEVSTDDDETW